MHRGTRPGSRVRSAGGPEGSRGEAPFLILTATHERWVAEAGRRVRKGGDIDAAARQPAAFGGLVGDEDVDRAADVNDASCQLALLAEIPTMLDSNGSAIVTVSSVGGVIDAPICRAYIGSTHGGTGLTARVGLE
jgi:hypothetical protein